MRRPAPSPGISGWRSPAVEEGRGQRRRGSCLPQRVGGCSTGQSSGGPGSTRCACWAAEHFLVATLSKEKCILSCILFNPMVHTLACQNVVDIKILMGCFTFFCFCFVRSLQNPVSIWRSHLIRRVTFKCSVASCGPWLPEWSARLRGHRTSWGSRVSSGRKGCLPSASSFPFSPCHGEGVPIKN